jgi:hypothetical protein
MTIRSMAVSRRKSLIALGIELRIQLKINRLYHSAEVVSLLSPSLGRARELAWPDGGAAASVKTSAPGWATSARFFLTHGDFTHLEKSGSPCRGNAVNNLRKRRNGYIIASDQANKEPSPMWIRESERCIQWNWIAIFSYSASLVVSLAIWRGLFRAVAYLVK